MTLYGNRVSADMVKDPEISSSRMGLKFNDWCASKRKGRESIDRHPDKEGLERQSYEATSQGIPRIVTAKRRANREKWNTCSQPPEGTNPAASLVWDF